ncbi:urease subunit beta [Microbacterium caowuchunii]|uniref:Urease subunit beta n=1 Tax=Microbacterium caowuchunii TaxID=2614638 RepID=A0A5J6KXA1_9MICO|nr:urease subunit beta [Microbacterium caowuchunii]KAA9129956.1 urease subunit beta [Microbacterium caowuchunii]QEW00435.1 urease subunit beta [Microbacterium caowuchunii]
MVNRKPNYHHGEDVVEINAGRDSATLDVTNTGDRPIQVGSHFHFFEVNPAMRFEREKAWGMHLDIPAGTGVRFEPGETKRIGLVAFAGARRLMGFNGLVNGGLDAEATKARAMRLLAEGDYENGPPDAVAGAGTDKKSTPDKAAPKKSGSATKKRSK